MDLNVKIVWLIFLGLATIVNAFKFPLDIQRCVAGDAECIQRVGNLLIRTNAKLGHNGINLIPLDPLNIPAMSIKQGAESPVNIELSFRNVNLIGLSEFEITKISGFKQDPNGKYQLKGKGPVLYLVGPYQISGRVLILPIQGEGDQNITLSNPDVVFNFEGKSVRRNGKEYMKIEKPHLVFTVSNIHFDFKNLYKGDKALGDSTNLFLNENWRDIFNEIKKPIFEAFTLIAENALTNVMNKVPYKDLFVEA